MAATRLTESVLLAGGIGSLLANQLLLRAGLRRRTDGWRRATGLLLRGENATFVLSAFSLDLWSDAVKPSPLTGKASRTHLADRLARFLAGEPGCHIHVTRGGIEDRAEACPGPSYTLGFADWIDGPRRFVRPDDWTGALGPTPCGESAVVLLNVIARISAGGSADVWVRVNHVGTDGVPVQEILSRLESAWGSSGPPTFPTSEAFAPHAGPRACNGRAGISEVQAFVDFAPLLAWRKQVNAGASQTMTLSAAVMWCLAKHPAFTALRMGTTVEVGAVGTLGRGVGVHVARPGDFQSRPGGLAEYVSAFNRGLELNRRRESAGCKLLDAAAHVPPVLARQLLTRALRGDKAFGSLALTVLKDAKVFGAPIADDGHLHGFIALGSAALDAGDGRRVGCITVKGPTATIATYPALIQDAVRQCDVRD